MSRTPIVFASVSAILLAAACGDSGTSDDTPMETAGPSGTADTTYEARVARNPSMDDNGSVATDDTAMAGDPGETDNGDAPLLDRLEGDWLSGEDDQAEMSIIDGTAAMMYDGEVLTVETLDVVDSCPDAVGEAADSLDLFTMTSDATGETLCYGVVSLENDRLELTSYPRGNTLTYTRQPMTDVLDTD
ncbi:MAG: hypothetical protein WA989_07805 [Henriciella sp.]|uniref:hypothetical protein n=1 Tax=Henriciella sp. TaxID=1968823 RepID=UPI003C785BED